MYTHVCMYVSYQYKNIPINSCMYVSYCKQQNYTVDTADSFINILQLNVLIELQFLSLLTLLSPFYSERVISPSAHTVFNLMCVCVCVCVCVKIYMLLLCSVLSAVHFPSKNSLEMLDDFSVQAGYAQAVADLSPLYFWVDDKYKPPTIFGSWTVFWVVDVGMINLSCHHIYFRRCEERGEQELRRFFTVIGQVMNFQYPRTDQYQPTSKLMGQ